MANVTHPTPDTVAAAIDTVASPELASRCRVLLETTGWNATMQTLGLTRSVITAIIARLPVRRANLVVADLRAPRTGT
jgi:hypothetical protein